MRILNITSSNSGVGFHRIMMPIVHMEKEYALITDVLNDELLEQGWDILVMNRMLNEIDAKQMDTWRTKYGFKLVVDNDDYWELSESHLLYSRYKLNNISKLITDYLEVADLCTCTHERLADEISKYNKNVHILPNALPYGQEQFMDNKTEDYKVRLFWSGSGTHERDLEILRQPFKRLQGMNIRTVIAGYNDGEKVIWDKMIDAFTCGLKLNPTIYNYAKVTEYMGAYTDSDISVIPLVDNKFNAMKSNLKVLETAAKKNPAIVSHVNPYLDMPVHYVKSQKDWYKHIKDLVSDADMRKESGQKLFEFCQKKYNFDEINLDRKYIYSKLCQ
jgi:hypothetical protein